MYFHKPFVSHVLHHLHSTTLMAAKQEGKKRKVSFDPSVEDPPHRIVWPEDGGPRFQDGGPRSHGGCEGSDNDLRPNATRGEIQSNAVPSAFVGTSTSGPRQKQFSQPSAVDGTEDPSDMQQAHTLAPPPCDDVMHCCLRDFDCPVHRGHPRETFCNCNGAPLEQNCCGMGFMVCECDP
jgi:hypothetical protein